MSDKTDTHPEPAPKFVEVEKGKGGAVHSNELHNGAGLSCRFALYSCHIVPHVEIYFQ